MKTVLYNLVFFITVSTWAFHPNTVTDKIEKKKTYQKEYTVGNQNEVNLYNQFGDINITTWNENRVVIEVVITASANDEKAVDAKLDNITVDFSQSGNAVTARTHIEGSSWNWGLFKTKNVQFKINYLVKMPVNNELNANNEYGFIYLSSLNGDSKINCQYGGITIENLNSSNNLINLDYCSNSSVQYIKNAKVNADYSNLSFTRVDNMTLNADYCTTTIEAVGALSYHVDYGNLKVKNANVLIGSNSYLNLSIGLIYKKLDLNCDYGTVKITKVAKTFESIKISADYLSVNLGLEENTPFTFDLSNDYADIKIDDFSPTYTHKEIDSFTKTYRGYVGSQNSSNITIRSEYGGIKIFQTN